MPQVFVLILSMTYRYIFLFLHTVNGIFLARKSRMVAKTRGAEQRRWIGGTLGALMSRSFKMSNDVYAAMLARGFTGEMRTLFDVPDDRSRLAPAGRQHGHRRRAARRGPAVAP